MITYRIRGINLLHGALLASASSVLFWLWAATHFQWLLLGADFTSTRYGLYSGIVIAALALDCVISKVRGTDLVQLDLPGVLRLSLRQVFTIFGAILFFLVASKDTHISRLFLFSLIPILYVGLFVLNRVCPRLLVSAVFSARRRQRTLVLGSPERACALLPWLRSKACYGVEIVGIISDEEDCSKTAPWPRIASTADLGRALAETGVSQVIALHLPDSLPHAADLGDICEGAGVRLLFVNNLHERFQRSLSFFEQGGVHLISLREEPLECPFNRSLKRALDVAVSLPVVLFILPPVGFLVYLAQRWQSPGPILFRQPRGGIHGGTFSIYKFRTMEACNPAEAAQATQLDPRVFPLGRWLRRSSLDELPQFLNVLKGEMSVVGPRPHMLEHDTAFHAVASAYRIRSLVKPGITGLAQVQGRRGEAHTPGDVIERVRSDVFYLEHWSLFLDWSIMLKTAWQILRPLRTAY